MLEFRFPDIGEGIAEGVILKWFVELGQEVKEGDSLFLVETDKVNAEIPAPTGGTILAKFGAVGDTINVGDVVVSIGDATAAAPPEETKENVKEEAVEEESAGVVGALEISSAVLKTSQEGMPKRPGHGGRKALATPVARHLARELGIDINQITGSGPAGRVMKEDIRKMAKAPHQKEQQAASLEPVVPRATTNGVPHGPEERVSLTQLGKTVARNMTLSKREIPHAAVMDEIDVTELVKFRARPRNWRKGKGPSSPTCLL